MKTFWKMTLAMLALFVGLMALGAMSISTGLVCMGTVQLAAFAMSQRRAACFNTVLTPEQVKEFNDILGQLKSGWNDVKLLPDSVKTLNDAVTAIKLELDGFRKAQIAQKSARVKTRRDEVGEDCARHLGALALMFGVRTNQLQGMSHDKAAGLFKDITGIEMRTALSSSDIPLPTIYSGDVIELVSVFGAARQYATVFPLGGSSVKLPKLGTDTTFGLIAASGSVTEKSPTVTNVTFTAEKFGGLIRLPSELDEDSIVPIGQFLARYAARQLAYVEDYQVFRSSGAASGLNGTAEGLCKSVITDSKVTQLASTKTHASDITLANLRTLRQVPDAAALRMGAYYFHPTFEALLSTFNSSGDKPYNPNAQISNAGGQPFMSGPTLDGFPIRWVDSMPAYTTSSVVSTVYGLFGDISFQYLGIRGGIRFDTSTEAGFTTDEILVRAMERLTTGKMATGCVAGVQTAAS